MATLTEISIISRRVIRYGIYAIILLISARYLLNLGTTIYKKIFPPKPEPPNVAFGKLPTIPFPERPDIQLSYKLELPEGNLPKLIEKVEVYKMPQSQTNIKALDNAKIKAKNLGFDPNGKPLIASIPNVYIFQRKGYPSSLTMNIITELFSVSYNINEDTSILKGLPPTPEAAISQVQSFLNGAGFLTEDLKNGTPTHILLKTEGGEFVPALSLSDANLIKVNIFRKPYGNKEDIVPVTPKMPQSNVWFIIAGGRGKQIIAGEYHYFPINAAEKGTYPIKTSETAWDELKNGKAFVANLGENETGNITIRRVYLGYYDAGQYAEVYQPVVVFEGDNNFYAYVPAITDDYYGK